MCVCVCGGHVSDQRDYSEEASCTSRMVGILYPSVRMNMICTGIHFGMPSTHTEIYTHVKNDTVDAWARSQ